MGRAETVDRKRGEVLTTEGFSPRGDCMKPAHNNLECEGLVQEWLSIIQTAKLLGVSTDHVYRRVRSGKLPVSNLGTFGKPYYRIRRSDIEAWMLERQNTPAPSAHRNGKAGSVGYKSRHH